jgi:hypothetical protein
MVCQPLATERDLSASVLSAFSHGGWISTSSLRGWFTSLCTRRMAYQPLNTEDGFSASTRRVWFTSLVTRRMVYQPLHTEDGLSAYTHRGWFISLGLYDSSNGECLSAFTHGRWFISFFTRRTVYQPIQTEVGLSASSNG